MRSQAQREKGKFETNIQYRLAEHRWLIVGWDRLRDDGCWELVDR
jgi:hypothetical protein